MMWDTQSPRSPSLPSEAFPFLHCMDNVIDLLDSLDLTPLSQFSPAVV